MYADSNNPKISIAAGIIIGLAASCVQSLGLTIQRKSHVLNQALPEAQQRVEHRRPLWLLGFTVFFLSNVLGSLFQIASLPVVILAPLGAVSLLWNAFFARFLLGDVFSPWMILGTVLIAGGAVLIAVFGIVPEPTHSLEDLLQLFRRPAFVAYFSLLGAFVAISLITTHILEYSYARRPIALPLTPPLSPVLNITSNDLPSIHNDHSSEQTPLLDRARLRSPSPTPTASTIVLSTPKPSRMAMLIAISYASFSGILSGMCLIFAKSGVELLLLTVAGHNQFWRWESWVLALGLAVFALLQLWYLHKSLVLADPTLVCPLAFCFYNLSSIFNGLVYYDQFSLLPTKYLILVLVGIVILLAGVWVVSVPANGGGVEVGIWQEGDAELGEGPIHLDTDSAPLAGGDERRGRVAHGVRGYNLSNLSGSRQRDSAAAATGVDPPATLEHADIALLDARTPDAETPPAAPFAAGHARQSSDASLTSPPHPRHRGLHLGLGSDSSPNRARHHHHHHHGHGVPRVASPPLGGASLGGFSIGLSPVSPGFAVLPRERRRRVSGMGFPDVVDQARAAAPGGATEGLRRTMSEGDASRPGVEAQGEYPFVAESVPRADGADNEPAVEGTAKGSREGPQARWGWLRRAFGGRRRDV